MNMNREIRYPVPAVLALLILTSCGGQEVTPDLRLQVQPLPGVYIQYESQSGTFQMGNELIERRISINAEEHRIFTTQFINKLSGRNYTSSLNEEFSFRANGIGISGVTGDLEYVDHKTSSAGRVKSLEINLEVKRGEIGILKVKLFYEVYPNMPIIRKWIAFENPGGSSITLDSILVESLSLLPGSQYDLEIYNTTLAEIVFNVNLMEGFLTGNESPGTLKYLDLYPDPGSVFIGMKPYYHKYATEIQLAPGEEFTCPGVFILFFKGKPDRAEELLAEFVNEYLAWSKPSDRSVWYENISGDVEVKEAQGKVQLAADSGADIFCLNRGWMDKRGDWNISENANLQNFSQYARDLGMKFGLGLDLAIADQESRVMAEYPQWAVKSKDGSDHVTDDGGRMMCLGSDYTLYMAETIDSLVRELGLDYIKLNGPLIPDNEAAGCFSEDHVHRSSAESLWYIYDGLFAICEYLHTHHPSLIIDVSPESYNPGGAMDLALLKHADVSKLPAPQNEK
jgi:alpha-galactosidase